MSLFAPLQKHAPVALRRSACLRSRLHASSCRACENACPAGCLTATAGGVTAAAGCTGCGRCAAACPTGALRVSGFEALMASPAASVVACARARSQPGQLRLPCLGGLSEADLVELCARAPRGVTTLLDENGCADCGSGRGERHPVAATLERVQGLMRSAGVPPDQLPRLATSRSASVTAQDPMHSGGRARRGFFAALCAAPHAAHPHEGPAGKPGSSSVRRRLLRALETLAQRHGGTVDRSLFHALQVAPGCDGHRVCASVCPTGALGRYRSDGGRAGIAFDPVDCIGCGHCAAACPSAALSLHAGAGEAGGGRRMLTAFAVRDCTECGTQFIASASETRCQRCARGAQLAQAAFNRLFKQSPHSGTWSPSHEEHR